MNEAFFKSGTNPQNCLATVVKMMARTISLLLIVFCFSISLPAQTKDAVKAASDSNDRKADANMIDSSAAEFLVQSADARMMDIQEGKLAVKRGTTSAIRDYGTLMVKDQSILLKKIRALAAAKKIELPASIGKKKQKGKEDLMTKMGSDFDKKFLKMMIIDHKRDVKLFKEAKEYQDREVSEFAVKYLPMIQSHLDKAKKLSDEQ